MTQQRRRTNYCGRLTVAVIVCVRSGHTTAWLNYAHEYLLDEICPCAAAAAVVRKSISTFAHVRIFKPP